MDLIKPGSSTDYGILCPDKDSLEEAEKLALIELLQERPTVSRYYRLGTPVGSSMVGKLFNDLDFLKHSVHIVSAKVGVAKGIVCQIVVEYSNGLVCSHGHSQDTMDQAELLELSNEERIIACSIETGEEITQGEADEKARPTKGDKLDTTKPRTRITRFKLYTNRGRALVAQDKGVNEQNLAKIDNRGIRRFRNLTLYHFDPIMEKSYIKGFWGYSENGRFGAMDDGIWRLGVLWGNDLVPEVPQVQDTGKPAK